MWTPYPDQREVFDVTSIATRMVLTSWNIFVPSVITSHMVDGVEKLTPTFACYGFWRTVGYYLFLVLKATTCVHARIWSLLALLTAVSAIEVVSIAVGRKRFWFEFQKYVYSKISLLV